MNNLWSRLHEQLLAQWVVCRTISDRRSVQYAIRFSYPAYLVLVLAGILAHSPYILAITALIAFLGSKLPMHPFDYLYNFVIARMGGSKIPGRGSELQVNSTIALVFNIVVIALIVLNIPISFTALAIIYAVSSLFFTMIFLVRD